MANVNALGEVHLEPIGKVKPYPGNPRKITDRAVALVAKSLQEFGWQQPIVVDSEDVIIAGHTRLLAALSLGLKVVPVVVAGGLTPRQVAAYRIADNRTGDFTSWDFSELAKQLEDLYEDFADVLALEDWESVMADFEKASLEDTEITGGDDELSDYLHGGTQLTVVATDKDTATQLAATIIDLDGVLDVRVKR